MTKKLYTAITFAPVQGFIEKSRKLRDLYGSSFILSYLSYAICNKAKAEGHDVISPAIINITQGTPNYIIIAGDFPKNVAIETFNDAWKAVVEECRKHIELTLNTYNYTWQRQWKAWKNYAWEFFWTQATGETTEQVRKKLTQVKTPRNWTGINWQGESSTLSGADAIAFPNMTDKTHPLYSSIADQTQEIKNFYQALSNSLPESIIDESEYLSIPELIKRLITLDEISKKLNIPENQLPSVEIPRSFVELNRFDNNLWTGWFQGDGDRMGKHISNLDDDQLKHFSKAMLTWGKGLKNKLPKFLDKKDIYKSLDSGRIIYAGGDDFLGVLYRDPEQTAITGLECLNWFYTFPSIWQQHSHANDITVSIGFVWAGPKVPQRDVLQHCREAEKSAKSQGRDRLAIRILFNSSNMVEWACPWWCLQTFLTSYTDRDGDNIISLQERPKRNKKLPNWTHFYNDVAVLESRHAFDNNQTDVALALFEIYFSKENRNILEQHLWDADNRPGILGNTPHSETEENHRKLNQWIINISQIGFHLIQ